MSWFRRHEHQWGPWRATLMRLTDDPWIVPATEARHCGTCHKMQMRAKEQQR